MSFYISVDHYGKNILYRGYTDTGKRFEHKYPFKPKLFLPSQKPSCWKTMDKRDVIPIEFDNRHEMSDFVKKYEGTSGFQYYGCDRVILQFLQHKFPNEIKFTLFIV